MSARPRILILSDGFPPDEVGGAERIAYYHAKGLVSLGFDVRVFAGTRLQDAARWPAHGGSEEGIAVDRGFRMPGSTQSERIPASVRGILLGARQLWNPVIERRVRSVVAGFQPNVVHAHYIRQIPFSALGVPGAHSVITFHGYQFECLRGGLSKNGAICEHKHLGCATYNRAVEIGLRRASRVVAISRFAEERLRGAGYARERIAYIPNGVPDVESRELTDVPDTKRILFVGRLERSKGLPELLEAFSRIRDHEARLMVAGSGELESAVMQAARTDDRVEFLGRVSHESLAGVYRSARVVVVPSRWHEVMNTVICEAQSWARPVIATPLGGNGDMIEHDRTGLLCPPGDVDALVRAIQRVLHERGTATRLAVAGFRAVQRFSMEKHLERIVRLYREMGAI